MAGFWLDAVLWVIRALRILLILRCLASCFVSRENKIYRFFYILTFPLTAPVNFAVTKITRKSFNGFDGCAFAVYVILWCITGMVMGAKVGMGLM